MGCDEKISKDCGIDLRINIQTTLCYSWIDYNKIIQKKDVHPIALPTRTINPFRTKPIRNRQLNLPPIILENRTTMPNHPRILNPPQTDTLSTAINTPRTVAIA